MELAFYKYQGTGNDFVLIDNRLKTFDTSNTKRIQHICDRKFGVGADGFICLENDANFDFKMVYLIPIATKIPSFVMVVDVLWPLQNI